MTEENENTEMKTVPALRERPLDIGRIVHYVLDEELSKDPSGPIVREERPAIVVRPWSDDCANLQVFTDCSNDVISFGLPDKHPKEIPSVLWRTSVDHDATEKKPGTWHWPDE